MVCHQEYCSHILKPLQISYYVRDAGKCQRTCELDGAAHYKEECTCVGELPHISPLALPDSFPGSARKTTKGRTVMAESFTIRHPFLRYFNI